MVSVSNVSRYSNCCERMYARGWYWFGVKDRVDTLIGVARAAIDRVLSELTTGGISSSTVKELRCLLDRVDLGTTFAYSQFRVSRDSLLDGHANAPT
jgi:hypothetical protein